MQIKNYKSGLRIVHNEKNDIDIVNFNIYVNVGSVNEQPEKYGLAHFCEHMFFKSTDKHTYQEISTILDQTGTRNNAFTSHYKTCFYFKSVGYFLEKNLEIFSEMFFNKTFNEVDIKNEKKVVLEELKMSKDDAGHVASLNAYKELYKNTILEHPIIGTNKTINSFTAKDLIEFKDKFYTPENVVISCSGNVSFEELERLLKKYYAPLFKGKFDGEFKEYDVVNATKEGKFVSKFKDNEQTMLDIVYDFGNLSEMDSYINDCYFALLGFGMSSKLFVKIREEQGLAYSVYASSMQTGSNKLGVIGIATSFKKVSKALTSILEVLKECADGKITEKELEIAKNKYISGLVFSNESNQAISSKYGSDLISRNRVVEDKTIVQALNSITVKQVVEFAKKVYSCNSYVVSSAGKSTVKELKAFKRN